MEERVKFLEKELQRYAESFEELTYHYSTIHNFLLQHFGATFKNFVLADNATATAINGGGPLESEQGTYEDGEEDDNENGDYLNDAEIGEEEQEEEDEAECTDINLDSYLEIDQVEDDQVPQKTVQKPPQIRMFPSPVAQQSSLRNGNNGTSQVMRNTQPQKTFHANVSSGSQKPQPQSSTSGGMRITKVLPALIQRPGTSSQQFHNMRIQQSGSGLGKRPHTSINASRPVIGGNRGNEVLLSHDDEDFKAGKYSKFYSKVNEELIQCKMCHKILKRRGKFIQHLRTHTGEKPFQCQFCPAAFSRKDNMNVHITKHHSGDGNGQNPNPTLGMQMSQYGLPSSSSHKSLYGFKCHLCSKLFANEKIYQVHMKLVHPPSNYGDDEGNDDEDDNEYYEDEEAEPMGRMEMEGQEGQGYGYDEDDGTYLEGDEEGNNEFEEDFMLEDLNEGQ